MSSMLCSGYQENLNFFYLYSTGTAGMMEVHAGKILWGRSVELHNMRYTTVLSDGDSKMYDALVENNPYGSDHPIH